MKQWRLVALLAAIAALAAPARALSGVVESYEGEGVSFEANAGEANVLTVVLSADRGNTKSGQATFTDTGAPLTPGEGCRSVTESTVVCSITEVASYEFTLGDGADIVRLSGTVVATADEIRVDGDAGADLISLAALAAAPAQPSVIIHAGGGNDVFFGGAAPEYFIGESGSDTARTGAGSDAIEPGPGDDRIDGGTGRDLLDMRSGGRLVVNLATGRAMGRGDDRIRRVEDVAGAEESPNVLIGNAHANRLWGAWAAADRLVGGGGNDVLRGDSGHDVLVGGPGRDRMDGGGDGDVLLARDGRRDRVIGGPGRDCAAIDRGLDLLSGTERLSCESSGTNLTGRTSRAL